MGWWWLACAQPELEAEVRPSQWIEAAWVVSWDGPAGSAALEVQLSPVDAWRAVASEEVPAGASELPLALLPTGSWRWRIRVDTSDGTKYSPVETLRVPDPPASLGRMRLEVDKGASEAAEGWVVAHRYATKPNPADAYAMVVDGDGRPVWWKNAGSSGGRVIRVRPGADGRSIVALIDHEDPLKRRIDRYTLDGETYTSTIAPEATHDFVEGSDGTFTFLSYVYGPPLQPFWPSTAADGLTTVPEGATDPAEAVTWWSAYEDYDGEPYVACWHAEPGVFLDDHGEWTHGNSLVRAPGDDGYYLLLRHLDAVVFVLDDGTVAWQVGGRDETLAAVGGQSLFEHGHTSDAWADRLLIFDNGDHTPEPIVSRIVELRVDAANGLYEEVWSLQDPNDAFVSFLGDARRLPGGNTLAVWTSRGQIAEFTPEGDELWRLNSDESIGRAVWVESLSLR